MSADPGPPAPRLLLVGMMGAGKSTLGRRVADRLGWPYFDSDEMVQAATGRTVPEIFAIDGEAAFRAAETAALTRAVAGDGPAVVSVAGGAVLSPANRDLVRAAGTVVWLRARVATLTDRVGDGAGRPLLDEDPAGALEALAEVRRPLYEAVAGTVVDVDDRHPDELVDELVALVAPTPPGTGPAGGGPPT